MHRMNKVISTIVTLCFLLNTIAADLALGQTVNFKPNSTTLNVADKIDDILGPEFPVMRSISMLFEGCLAYLRNKGFPVTPETIGDTNILPDSIINSIPGVQVMRRAPTVDSKGVMTIGVRVKRGSAAPQRYWIRYSPDGKIEVYPDGKAPAQVAPQAQTRNPDGTLATRPGKSPASKAPEAMARMAGVNLTLESPIEQLQISGSSHLVVEVRNSLARERIRTLGDLLKHTRQDVSMIRGIGPKGLAAIEAALAANGMYLPSPDLKQLMLERDDLISEAETLESQSRTLARDIHEVRGANNPTNQQILQQLETNISNLQSRLRKIVMQIAIANGYQTSEGTTPGEWKDKKVPAPAAAAQTSRPEQIQKQWPKPGEVAPDRRVVALISGGESAGVNNYFALLAVKLAAQGYSLEVVRFGLDGLVKPSPEFANSLVWIDKMQASGILNKPGAVAGTARVSLVDAKHPEYMQNAVANLKDYCRTVVIVGGSDHMLAATNLSNAFKDKGINDMVVVALPKSIDYDAPDVYMIGADTAGTHANKLLVRAAPMPGTGKIVVCEVMGRDSGYLTVRAADMNPSDTNAYSRAELAKMKVIAPTVVALTPEWSVDKSGRSIVSLADVVRAVKRRMDKYGAVTLAVSEGFRISAEDKLLQEILKNPFFREKFTNVKKDGQGNLLFNEIGIGTFVVEALSIALGKELRLEQEKNLLYELLGYCFRCVEPGDIDRAVADSATQKAADMILNKRGEVINRGGVCVAVERGVKSLTDVKAEVRDLPRSKGTVSLEDFKLFTRAELASRNVLGLSDESAVLPEISQAVFMPSPQTKDLTTLISALSSQSESAYNMKRLNICVVAGADADKLIRQAAVCFPQPPAELYVYYRTSAAVMYVTADRSGSLSLRELVDGIGRRYASNKYGIKFANAVISANLKFKEDDEMIVKLREENPSFAALVAAAKKEAGGYLNFGRYTADVVAMALSIDKKISGIRKNVLGESLNSLPQAAAPEQARLRDIIGKMVPSDGGILAADESTGTAGKRLESVGLPNTPENRQTMRQLILTAPGLEGAGVSAVILYAETFGNTDRDGNNLVQKYLIERGIMPGIKTDEGLIDDPDSPGEKLPNPKGLQNLPDMLSKYEAKGAVFTKWRVTIAIDTAKGLPTETNIRKNAEVLAKSAKQTQEAGLVPIVEPEVLLDGPHDIAASYRATTRTLEIVFEELAKAGVWLDGVILKTSMILSGNKNTDRADSEIVGYQTLKGLLKTVPAEVPAIVFLSGGQGDDEANENLDAVIRASQTKFETARNEAVAELRGEGKVNAAERLSRLEQPPWQLSYSFGRGLQRPGLKVWAGKEENFAKAQGALLKAAKTTQSARLGRLKEPSAPAAQAAPTAAALVSNNPAMGAILAAFSGKMSIAALTQALRTVDNREVLLNAKSRFQESLAGEQTEERLQDVTEKIDQILDVIDRRISELEAAAPEQAIAAVPQATDSDTLPPEAQAAISQLTTGAAGRLNEAADKIAAPVLDRIAQDDIKEAIQLAGQAGAQVPTQANTRYNLLVTEQFFRNGELNEHKAKYGDRFDLDRVSGATPEQFIQNVLAKSAGKETRTVVLVPNDLPKEQLERLANAGIRFVMTNTNELISARTNKDEYRAKFQLDTYIVMLLTRAIDNTTDRSSPVYRLLSFYLRTHFTFAETIAIDDYIMAIAKNEIGKLIQGILSYRPAKAYDKPDYEKVAATLIAA